MLANNLANATTGGYKGDREFYSLYTAAEATQAADEGMSPSADTQPIIEKHWTDYSQGTIRSTGNSLDVALDGPGFLAVNGPSGILYTRNGNLRVNATGVLTTAEGYALRTGDNSTLQTISSSPITIEKDGTVKQDGQQLGQLSVVDFPDRGTIEKRGFNYFMNVDPQAIPKASAASIQQGHLEDSNVGSAESAVRLVNVMRQFETLQKALTIGSDMNKYAIEEVARVTQ